MIWNMKPDRIQFGPPIDDGGQSWTERAPALTHTFEFETVHAAALFLIYADHLAGESDEIRVIQSLFGRSLTITAKPVTADYLPHAVYEFASRIDAAVEALRRPRFDHDGLDDEDREDDLAGDDLADDDLADPDFEGDDFALHGLDDLEG